MLIEALRLAQGKDLHTLQQYIGDNDCDPREKVQVITEVYNNLGIDKLCHEQIEKYSQTAFSCMDEILVPEDRKLPLIALAQSLMNRDH